MELRLGFVYQIWWQKNVSNGIFFHPHICGPKAEIAIRVEAWPALMSFLLCVVRDPIGTYFSSSTPGRRVYKNNVRIFFCFNAIVCNEWIGICSMHEEAPEVEKFIKFDIARDGLRGCSSHYNAYIDGSP